jgi:type VI secretion system secreted protein VgrG
MQALMLQFENGEDLDVRSFRVVESVSRPFKIEIVARSSNHDLSFESLVGRPAVFRLTNGAAFATVGVRTWSGICTRCEQTRVELSGLSTYELTIEPQLWLLSQRRNHRIFQHQSVPEIVSTLLDEWGVDYDAEELDREAYPALEIRIQYGETDLAFVTRLLEEAGISFSLEEQEERLVMVLSDRLHGRELREGGPLSFVDQPDMAQAAQVEYVTNVRVRRETRPAKVVLRDFDFRNPRFELEASAAVPAGIEEKLEQYHYAPGRFVTEGHRGGDTPVADDRGVARFHQPAGSALAQRWLEAQRSNRRGVVLSSNAFDLSPGTVFTMMNHPRSELALGERLLVTELQISGEVSKEWLARVTATFADTPYRPLEATPRPNVVGVQSAIVVGPEGDTVHTDEFGRVRVQFHWDRSKPNDETSSCWVRVSQAWAGTGYGLINLPRVGHEVLIGFVEGNPDQPVVVGRVFNGAQQVPYKLPGSKLVSAWKSDSNSNIILFDDTPGEEGFYEQAEKDRVGIVKNDETYMTGGERTVAVGKSEDSLAGDSWSSFALMEHSILAGKAVSSTAVNEWSGTGGLEASVSSGKEASLSVQPVVPFIMALIDVITSKATLDATLPGGQPPDLSAVLPDFTKGSLVLQAPEESEPVLLSKEEVEEGVEDVVNLFGLALQSVTPQKLSKLIQKHGLLGALDVLLASVKESGIGPKSLLALADMQALLDHLKKLLASLMEQEPEEEEEAEAEESEGEGDDASSKALELLKELVGKILDEIVPSTSVTVKHQNINLETENASIEIDGKHIKLTAEGDITIKADGKISISGDSVNIYPKPTNNKPPKDDEDEDEDEDDEDDKKKKKE